MRRSSAGFTLIEVMITVAIIAILVTVAMPAYRDHVVRSNRTAATGYMLELAALQERNFLDERAYATSMADLGVTAPAEVSANYAIVITADNSATPPSYTITATPSGGQSADDDCGTLTLNSQGTKGHASGATRCWN